jgi:alpha-tubulin suppressor-like RCC1 family protein
MAAGCGTSDSAAPAPDGGALRDVQGGDANSCAAGQSGCGSSCCTVVPIAAGDAHTCALDDGGGVSCWGWNHAGQLGDGTQLDRSAPVRVAGLDSGIVALTAGLLHTCALDVQGGVTCWGDGTYGQLGDGLPIGAARQSTVPVSIPGLTSGVVAIAAAAYATCAAVAAGPFPVMCWGPDALGTGVADAMSSVPVPVAGLDGPVQALTAGAGFFCGTTASGEWCWGKTLFGAFGNGQMASTNDSAERAGVALGMARAWSASERNLCALSENGSVVCWGDGSLGELGILDAPPDAIASDAPAAVWGLSAGALGLAVGSQALHACTWTTGAVWCWGYNSDGQVGAPTTDAAVDVVATPVAVSMLAGPFVAVAMGEEHTCAQANGRTFCWGSNEVGQLGVGLISDGSSLPVEVTGR